jgi:molybdopterin molybdotransferase
MRNETITTHSCCSDKVESGTLKIHEALTKMLENCEAVSGFEKVALQSATGRILAEAISSPIDVPSHTNSAVDGFAINHQDLPQKGDTKTVPVEGMVVAGKPHQTALTPGCVLRIMTGAKIPEGADTVIMQEHVEFKDGSIRIDDRHVTGQNVRQAGEDIKQGSVILTEGKQLTPADIGLIASLGTGEVIVKRPPRVTIFSTGDEIHSIGQQLADGGIYDSNRYTLAAALNRLSITLVDMGIIADDKQKLLDTFSSAAKNSDVIITSGGVSVGEADYTKEVLTTLGTVDFWKVAIKPGRPVAFGKIGDATFFGLPGNPVAVMVTYYQFVLPTLYKIMGITDSPVRPTLKVRSLEKIRKLPGRTEFVRGIISQDEAGDWVAKSTGKQGSGILKSMSEANAFLVLEHDRESIEVGDTITAQPFSGLI